MNARIGYEYKTEEECQKIIEAFNKYLNPEFKFENKEDEKNQNPNLS